MSNDAEGGSSPRVPQDGKDKARRELSTGDGDAWAVVSYLIAGVGFWGLVGWLLDRWMGTGFMVMIGVFVGFAGAFYLIVRRFGKG